jgi:ribosomal protein L40E
MIPIFSVRYSVAPENMSKSGVKNFLFSNFYFMEKVSTKKCRSCQADIPVGAKVCQHCKAKQGNWFARHWILTTLLVLFIL